MNDFNPGNFLVDGMGVVRLIDCDSFLIPVEGGEPFMTRTFMPEFAAPELLLHPELFNQPRTPEQVRFSLAVVIYMAYARCGGGDPAENLKSGKCPLDKNSGVRMPVSWYKSVSWLTPGLRDCFLRMFRDGFAHPSQRPLLGELRNELVHFIEVMKTSRSENQRAILPATARRGNEHERLRRRNHTDVTNPAPRCPVMLLLDTSGSMGDCIDELRTRGGSRLPRKRVRLHHRLRRRGGAPHRLLPSRRRRAHIPAGRHVPGGFHVGQGGI